MRVLFATFRVIPKDTLMLRVGPSDMNDADRKIDVLPPKGLHFPYAEPKVLRTT